MIQKNEERTWLSIKTTKGTLHYFRDWDNSEGGIVMKDAQTIKRYKELKNQHPNAGECGVFFAFSNEQFDEGYNRLVESGKITDKDKIYYHPGISGLYGTNKGIDEFLKSYQDRDKLIPKECDPQEVYFYEYNNHESMYDWDGDAEAMRLVILYWGVDVAETIKRFDAAKEINDLIQ